MKKLSIILILIAMTSCTALRRTFVHEINTQFHNDKEISMIENDISQLPLCVQRYFEFVKISSITKINNAHILFGKTIHIKEPNATPTNLICEQYNDKNTPYRNFYMKGKMKGIPFEGRENYINGKGNMRIKLLKAFTVVNMKGKETDESALVTYLAECSLLPTSFLNKNISWTAIDENTAKATISDNGNKISGIFYFKPSGELTKFVSDDRYYISKDNKLKKVQWIAELGNYKIMSCGLFLSSYLKATWYLPEGEFLYFNGMIEDIKYNETEKID